MLTGIIHIGMGDHALAEARALNAANRGEGGAFSVRQKGDTQDVLTLDGTRFDLRGEAGRVAFAASLELDSEGAALRRARLWGCASSEGAARGGAPFPALQTSTRDRDMTQGHRPCVIEQAATPASGLTLLNNFTLKLLI